MGQPAQWQPIHPPKKEEEGGGAVEAGRRQWQVVDMRTEKAPLLRRPNRRADRPTGHLPAPSIVDQAPSEAYTPP